ncbi:MAG: helix-turn-helix domain-containing protein [Sphingobium sp.]
MSDDYDFDEAQAARILGVSAKTLSRWRRSGAIGYHRMPGGRIRYTTDQLANFRASCRVMATNVLTSTQLTQQR